MAKVLICDRCATRDSQPDFEHFTVYREDAFHDKVKDHFALDLCGQCATEFREFYRFAWSLPNAQTA